MNNKLNSLLKLLNKTKTEEEVKAAWAKCFELEYDTADDLGEVSRELFAQFLYRIRREFKGKTAWLGLFSKLKYINATNDQKLRDSVMPWLTANSARMNWQR